MIQRADSNRKTLLALLVVLAGLLVLRYCAFGLSYYPQLDDYIQYCNYRQSTEPFWEMALRVGLLASRPLANIADYFIWSPLFDHMLVGVALVCVLYVACVGMMWSLLRRHFPVGPVFPVVMTLLPLGMEGLYWMSASTVWGPWPLRDGWIPGAGTGWRPICPYSFCPLGFMSRVPCCP